MKRLSLTLVRLLAVAILWLGVANARAQSATNVTIRATVVDGATNVFNISLPPRYVQGLQLAWARDLMVAQQQTNTPPTFSQSVTNEIILRLKSLSDIAIANEVLTNKVGPALQQLTAIWPNMTAADQTNIAAIFQKYVQ